jgi:hypothetical protein
MDALTITVNSVLDMQQHKVSRDGVKIHHRSAVPRTSATYDPYASLVDLCWNIILQNVLRRNGDHTYVPVPPIQMAVVTLVSTEGSWTLVILPVRDTPRCLPSSSSVFVIL